MRFKLFSLLILSSLIFFSSSSEISTLKLKFGPDDAYHLVEGMLKGLEFKDVDALMKCFNNIPDIYNDVLTIINLLQNIDIHHFKELVEAIIKIFGLVDEILHAITPCANVQDSQRIKEIIADLMNANIQQIALNILLHGGKILSDLLALPTDFNSGNFYLFGFHIGDIITQIFLSSSFKFSPQDSYNMTYGILKGLKFTDVDALMKCFKDCPDIYNDILEIIALLQNIDIKHIQELIEALSKIFELVSKILISVDPCANVEDSQRIHEIIEKLKELDLQKVATNIVLHGGKILLDILDLPKEQAKGNYYKLGFDLGDIVELILLS